MPLVNRVKVYVSLTKDNAKWLEDQKKIEQREKGIIVDRALEIYKKLYEKGEIK